MSNQESHFIFTQEEAERLVTEALDTSPDEPEPIVKLLLILHDHEQDARVKDSIYMLMKAAYKGSIADDNNFQEYLEAIRQRQNPVKES